jgi:hypothetical protein
MQISQNAPKILGKSKRCKNPNAEIVRSTPINQETKAHPSPVEMPLQPFFL